MPFVMEKLAVERDDAATFLAAMLQSVQTKRGENAGFRVSVDAEYAAFVPQASFVGVNLDLRITGVFRRTAHL